MKTAPLAAHRQGLPTTGARLPPHAPLLLSLALLAAGCRSAGLPAFPPGGDDATVFVPGYKGSFLAEENGEHAWVTPGQPFGAGDRSLGLEFPGQRPGPRFGPLHPDGPVTRLSVLGIGEDVYLPFLEFAARSLPGVVPFAYDWRRDVRDSGQQLCAAIEALHATRVTVIAHSMGGLVTLHCLLQGQRKIRRIVFAGTPFRGAPEIYKDLVRGDPLGRNRALLSAEALFSFPAAWQLLPPEGPIFVSESAAPAPQAVRSLSPRLGVFAVLKDGQPHDARAYGEELERQLAAHADHWAAIAKVVPAVPVLIVVGEGNKTVAGIRTTAGAPDFDHPPLADGDGTVLATSARPSFPHDELVTRTRHTALLNDPEVQAAIARFAGEPGHAGASSGDR